jgi:hypothetical protein
MSCPNQIITFKKKSAELQRNLEFKTLKETILKFLDGFSILHVLVDP